MRSKRAVRRQRNATRNKSKCVDRMCKRGVRGEVNGECAGSGVRSRCGGNANVGR